MLRLPYGVASFEGIREKGSYYIDRSRYIPILESLGNYLLLLRPRRFGKSLFLNTLAAYYDLNKKQEFAKLFKGLYISNHPTSDANKYLILKFDFSGVSSDSGYERLRESFGVNVRRDVLTFITGYRAIWGDSREMESGVERIEGMVEASDIIKELLGIISSYGVRVYLLIDEYGRATCHRPTKVYREDKNTLQWIQIYRIC